MKSFTVHLNQSARSDARQIVLIREGLAWPALAVPLLWLLYHRLWFEAAGYLGASLLLTAAFTWAGAAGLPLAAASLLLNLIVALEGNDRRRAAEARKGARLAAVSRGANLDDAEERFLRAWDGALPAPDLSPRRFWRRFWGRPLKGGVWPAAQERKQAAPAKFPARDARPVLGLFPEPGWTGKAGRQT